MLRSIFLSCIGSKKLFAFLGVLRIRNEENVWSEVTGGKSNHIGGARWGNFKDII
jgi:hypothetical protein